MRFWDTAAIVPLLAEQPASGIARQWLEEDGDLVVWWGTAVECASAIARLERSGVFDARAAAALQLGAALVWSGSPATSRFHTLDGRLAHAAAIEGFEVTGGNGEHLTRTA